MISSRRMFLSQITRWPDTYEGSILRKLIDFAVKKKFGKLPERVRRVVVEYFLRSQYAQSWTTLEESDALWRIYSPDGMGVRISVNLDNLLSEVKRNDLDISHGNVIYCLPEDAQEQIAFIKHESLDAFYSKCCLHKRPEFMHEKEYRLLIRTPLDTTLTFEDENYDTELEDKTIARFESYPHEPIKYYEFNPSLIGDVTLDPRAPDWFITTIRNLCSSIEETRGVTVKKSDLYNQPS
jgi:hypothetical protein